MTGYLVYYDDQCEICQAGVSWLRILDRRSGRVRPEALSTAHLPEGWSLDDCQRELHVVDPDGKAFVGWEAVAVLARLFPVTWVAGAIGAVPPFSWAGRMLYRYVARNRYALSRCRGGACGSARPAAVRAHASMGAFWSCRAIGLILRMPLVAASWASFLIRNLIDYVRLFRRRITLLDGRLTLQFLGSPTSDLVPLLFGERFVAIFYDGIAIDPGSTNMRASLRRALEASPLKIHAVAATHHHEEHSGNLDWLASHAGAGLHVSPLTVARLKTLRIPLMRRFVIGQPPPVLGPVTTLSGVIAGETGDLRAIATPGHCDDHVSFYDPRLKLLLAGDAFMGAYFSSPNPDVDSIAWIQTLETLLDLGVEILVEGHGHIHTLRTDIPDLPGVVIRHCPQAALRAKLDFFQWVRRQVEAGLGEGLP